MQAELKENTESRNSRMCVLGRCAWFSFITYTIYMRHALTRLKKNCRGHLYVLLIKIKDIENYVFERVLLSKETQRGSICGNPEIQSKETFHLKCGIRLLHS